MSQTVIECNKAAAKDQLEYRAYTPYIQEESEKTMWCLEEEKEPETIEAPASLGEVAKSVMTKIVDAEAVASKRAMEIISLQADETEALLAGEALKPEQFNVLIEERKEIRKVACEQANKSMFKSWQFWLCAAAILTTSVAVARKI